MTSLSLVFSSLGPLFLSITSPKNYKSSSCADLKKKKKEKRNYCVTLAPPIRAHMHRHRLAHGSKAVIFGTGNQCLRSTAVHKLWQCIAPAHRNRAVWTGVVLQVKASFHLLVLPKVLLNHSIFTWHLKHVLTASRVCTRRHLTCIKHSGFLSVIQFCLSQTKQIVFKT